MNDQVNTSPEQGPQVIAEEKQSTSSSNDQVEALASNGQTAIDHIQAVAPASNDDQTPSDNNNQASTNNDQASTSDHEDSTWLWGQDTDTHSPPVTSHSHNKNPPLNFSTTSTPRKQPGNPNGKDRAD